MLYFCYNNDVLGANMKYWKEETVWNGCVRHRPLPQHKLPNGKSVWAVAYSIDNESMYPHLRKTPVRGIITVNGDFFVEYKKGTNIKKKSGIVNSSSRMYADTEKEAVEMYNALVQDRINLLYKIIEDAEDDKI